jgi:hypothetical protein
VVVAMGVNADGRRELLGIKLSRSERASTTDAASSSPCQGAILQGPCAEQQRTRIGGRAVTAAKP